MIIPRETIYVALWNKVSRLPQFKTTSRRLRHWDDVPAAEQPALFMVEHQQTPHQTKGLPPTWVFSASLFLYDTCSAGTDEIPATRLNMLLDAVDNALAPNVLGYQTLGNLVSHCWISGPIEIYEGYKGMMDQSVAIIPIEIKIPDSSGPV